MHRLTHIWCAIALLGGAISRLLPLLDKDGRLLKQFVTEDGYLMLTIARNMALGHGMSIAEGTIATNGVQPLATFIYAGCFWLVDADRSSGVAIVHCLSLLFALLAAWLLYRLGRGLLRGQAYGNDISALAAAAWFGSPLVVAHSMNALETGLYLAAVLLAANVFVTRSVSRPQQWSLGFCAVFGLLLGIVFLTRNDAAFLILAACVVHVGTGLGQSGSVIQRRLLETTVFGAISVLVALPWLAYNYRLFGHIMPISGISESLNATFGQNAYLIPAKMFEYLLVMLPVPLAFETHKLVQVAGTLLTLLALAIALIVFRRGAREVRVTVALVGIYGVLLTGYYGFFFGVDFFLGRYMSPLSPFLALFSIWLGYRVLSSLPDAVQGKLVATAAIVALLLLSGLNVRLYLNGSTHMHEQVVEWIDNNVADDEWVGAIQTGTIGFFHDRTLNLDGKVNPDALRVRLDQSSVLPYVIDSEIKYIADWVGIASWVDDEKYRFGDRFELVLRDESANLGVLRRRH